MLVGGLLIMVLALRELAEDLLRLIEAMRLVRFAAPAGVVAGVVLAVVGLLLLIRRR